jgi:glycosyltransferase involved in cell wall biosynthesis
MSKIFFLCGLFPSQITDEIKEKSKGIVQNAADALQWSIVKGLDGYTDKLTLATLPFIGAFPARYKDCFMRTFPFSHRAGAEDVHVGFMNLMLIKYFSRYMNSKARLKRWARKADGDKTILIYSVHAPFIKAAVEAKRKDKSIKVCLIVPDLPEFMGGESNLLYRLLRIFQEKLLVSYMKEIDSFVVLSKYMVEPLGIGQRPWRCVEGIFDTSDDTGGCPKEINKTILYSGTLAQVYGIMNLLDAFDSIKDPDYRLWICGEGDCREEIERRAAIDKRITYWGQRPRKDVLILQKRATVLVNPRTSEGEFTKYSFPSKIMEYFASGTPTIMHRLTGIPDEYFQYCIIAEREDACGLAETIVSLCRKGQNERDAIGKKAQEFIFTHKNPVTQVGKIFEIIRN